MQVYDHSPPIFPLRFNPQLLDRAYQCAYGVAAWGAEDRINKPRHRSTERASQEDAKDEDRLHATVPPPPLPPQPTSAVLCPTSIGFSAWLSGFDETFAMTLFAHRVLWRHPSPRRPPLLPYSSFSPVGVSLLFLSYRAQLGRLGGSRWVGFFK